MRINALVSALAVALALTLAQRCRAESPAPPNCVQPVAVSPASVVVADSSVAVTIDPKPGATPVVGVVDPEPAWQPRGGKVSFTLRSSAADLAGVQVTVCFGWKGESFKSSPHIWVSELSDTERTYNAIVPPDLKWAPDGVQRTGFWIVPVADMRVMVTGGPTKAAVDVTRPVGITQPSLAILAAFLAVMLALLMFYGFACARQVPGRGLVLWLISTRNGVASLSQLQIMLWTFVVGASAVYVMVLSGGLIEITDGTLVLLGIAGGASVTSKLQSGQADNKPAPPPATLPAVPDPIPYLNLVGAPTDTEVRLAWVRPATGGATTYYSVQYRVPQSAWITVGEKVVHPHCTVLGLSPGTTYEFQVLAGNAAGLGRAIPPLVVTTAAAAQIAPGAPVAVAGLRTDEAPAVSLLCIAWSPVAGGAVDYEVQYRGHDSTEPWRDFSTTSATAMKVSPLSSGSTYDFRVRARSGNGPGPWSSVLTATTVRDPNWSDLVVAGPGRGEVDVTRVQMLFFTLVTAVFVAMTVLTTYTIPDIPPGFLILMGISNGVYLGNKFIPDGT